MIPVVLSVDLEPDGPGHLVTPETPWLGADAVRRWIDDILERSAARTGRDGRVNWLVRFDPQVEETYGSATYAVEAEPDLFARADERGDELGLHIHGWRRTPEGGWVDDFGDEAWLGECIDRSVAAFDKAFGRPCPTVSIGNRALTPAAIARFVHHGVAIDQTGEPANPPVDDGAWPNVRGAIPDYRRMPRHPHLLVPGLVELPLTAGRKRLGLHPKAHLSRMRRHGLRERLDQPLQLGGKDVPGTSFGELISDALARLPRPYLSFAVRSDGILNPVQRPRLVGHIAEVLTLPEAERFAFMTPTEAVEALGVH